MGCKQSGQKGQGDIIAISSINSLTSQAAAVNKADKNARRRSAAETSGSANQLIQMDPDVNGEQNILQMQGDKMIKKPVTAKQGQFEPENQDMDAMIQTASGGGGEESEDEEWTFMSKLKGLKQKFTAKISSKFKSQYKDENAQEEESESDGLASDDEFYVEPPEFGDQFMACKPWLGAIKEPDVVPVINPERPDESFGIDFVHGYKSDLTRQNLHYNNNQQCVYMTAALGIILDTETRTQQIFGGGEETEQRRKQQTKGEFGHSDDIVALCLSKDRTKVASGQVGLEPMVFVWDAETAERISMMTLPKGSRSTSALAFSADGNYIAAADMSDDHKVHLFDLNQIDRKGKCVRLGDAKKDRQKIFQIMWSPTSANTFCSVGLEHIFFWTAPQLQAKKATLPKGKKGVKLGFPSLAFSKTGLALLAASDGAIYTYNNGAPGKSFKGTHAKMVSCINCVDNPTNPAQELIITGGADKAIHLHLLDESKNLTKLLSYTVAATPRSVDFMGDQILAGLSNGTILELKNVLSDPESAQCEIQIRSHYDGEAWGLAMVDVPDRCLYFTSGDDNTILLYDAQAKKCIGEGTVSTVADIKTLPPKKKRGGASSMSNQHPHQQARALAFCESLNHLAVGHNDGCVSIRQITGLESADGSETLQLDTIISKMNQPKEWIEIMRYSAAADKLAVGSHDNFIYVYGTKPQGPYSPYAKLKGHSSYITALDWSADGDYIRSSCGAYELLFFSVHSKKQMPGGASATTSTTWTNHTVKFGWFVDGIYPSGTDGSHINIVEMSKDQTIIATGDDYGLVNLYRSPCREDHLAKSYRGHSEHVTNVKIYGDEMETMCSLGGQDQTLIQWKKQ